MPSVRRGQLYKRYGTWHARLYDAEGNRRDKGGFDTKTAAGDWLGDKLEEVAALRGGASPVRAVQRPQTVDALLDLFLDKHGRTVDPATKRNLTTQLRKARSEFGDRSPNSLLGS